MRLKCKMREATKISLSNFNYFRCLAFHIDLINMSIQFTYPKLHGNLQNIRFQRRLYGIATGCFHICMIPKNCFFLFPITNRPLMTIFKKSGILYLYDRDI